MRQSEQARPPDQSEQTPPRPLATPVAEGPDPHPVLRFAEELGRLLGDYLASASFDQVGARLGPGTRDRRRGPMSPEPEIVPPSPAPLLPDPPAGA